MSTHGPIQSEYREQMRQLGQAIDEALNADRLNPEVGFVLLMFPFGEKVDGRINYLSNGERESVHRALKELLERWEGRHPEEMQ